MTPHGGGAPDARWPVGPVLGVLGPVAVLRANGAGRVVEDLAAGHQATLAGLLLIGGARGVSTDRLSAEIWGESAPDDARATLRSHMSRLRRRLAGVAVIDRVEDGYRLTTTEPDDASRFEVLVEEAKAGLEIDPAVSIQLASDAERLWRGDSAFAGSGHCLMVAAESQRLVNLRIDALEVKALARWTAGMERQAALDAEAVVVRQPERSSAWALLARIQHDQGRTGDALQTIQQAFRAVGRGADLVNLEKRLLLDGSLNTPSDWRRQPATALRLRGPLSWSIDAEKSLSDVLAASRSGLQVARIVGEEGVGKSAVVARLVGQPDEGSVALWITADRGRRAPDRTVARLLALLDHRRRLRAADRPSVVDALVSVLQRNARRRHLVIVIDNGESVSAATIAILTAAIADSRIGRLPLLVVVAHRHDDRWASAGLTNELVVELAAVEEIALRDLLSETLDVDADLPAVAAAVHRYTAGNPALVRDVVEHLMARIRASPGTSLEAYLDEVPPVTRALVSTRLASLDSPARCWVEAAAVLGERFEPALVAAVAEMDAAVDVDLRSIELVVHRGPDAGRVRAELWRRAILEALPSIRLRRLHRRAADALAARQPVDDLGVLHHDRAAGPDGDDRRMIDISRARAHAARVAGAFEDAVDLLRPIVDRHRLLGRVTMETSDLALEIGELQRLADHPGARSTFIEAAEMCRGLDYRDGFARAALGACRWNAWFQEAGVVDQAAVDLLVESLGLDGTDPRLVARVQAQLAVELSFSDRYGRRARLMAQAAELSAMLGDPSIDADVLAASILVDWSPSTCAQRRGQARRLVSLGQAMADAEVEARGWLLQAVAELEGGDTAAAERCSWHAVRQGAHGRPFVRKLIGTVPVALSLTAGPTPAARAAVDDLFAEGERYSMSDAFTVYAAQTVLLSWDSGDLAGLRPQIEAAAVGSPGVPAWHAAAALASSETGDIPATVTALEPFVSGRIDPGNDWLTAAIVAMLADSCHPAGQAVLARQLYDVLLPWADQHAVAANGLLTLGSNRRALAMFALTAGDAESAAYHARKAWEANASAGIVSFAVRSARGLSQALCELGTLPARREALRWARRASTEARALGLGTELQRAEALLTLLRHGSGK